MSSEPGEGPSVSTTEAKQNLGRGFIRPRGRHRHEGGRSDPTFHRALGGLKDIGGPITERQKKRTFEQQSRSNTRT